MRYAFIKQSKLEIEKKNLRTKIQIRCNKISPEQKKLYVKVCHFHSALLTGHSSSEALRTEHYSENVCPSLNVVVISTIKTLDKVV